ncbi:MAG: response regulator [Bacteroidales bacterium]|nr:response regulator [Bacteroidales bacterium]
MGSEITVESEIGQGACFRFQLPYLASNFIEEDVKGEKPAASVRLSKDWILIVEDDLISRLYFQQILANHSAELIFAETGKEALLLFENHHPDVVLMDIRLPDINGLKVVQMIRKKNKKVVIIAQSAYAMPGDKDKALKAGCNDFIPKPIDSELLIEKLM